MDYSKILRLTLLFLGKSLLAISGAGILAFTFIEMFEGTPSIIELSILELLFSAVLYFLLYRHGKISINFGLKWYRILYLPLRNCGWLVLLTLLVLFYLMHQGYSLETLIQGASVEAIMDQLFSFGLILFCIYTATPRIPVDQNPLDCSAEETTW
jgi:hypothetical protein